MNANLKRWILVIMLVVVLSVGVSGAIAPPVIDTDVKNNADSIYLNYELEGITVNISWSVSNPANIDGYNINGETSPCTEKDDFDWLGKNHNPTNTSFIYTLEEIGETYNFWVQSFNNDTEPDELNYSECFSITTQPYYVGKPTITGYEYTNLSHDNVELNISWEEGPGDTPDTYWFQGCDTTECPVMNYTVTDLYHNYSFLDTNEDYTVYIWSYKDLNLNGEIDQNTYEYNISDALEVSIPANFYPSISNPNLDRIGETQNINVSWKIPNYQEQLNDSQGGIIDSSFDENDISEIKITQHLDGDDTVILTQNDNFDTTFNITDKLAYYIDDTLSIDNMNEEISYTIDITYTNDETYQITSPPLVLTRYYPKFKSIDAIPYDDKKIFLNWTFEDSEWGNNVSDIPGVVDTLTIIRHNVDDGGQQTIINSDTSETEVESILENNGFIDDKHNPVVNKKYRYTFEIIYDNSEKIIYPDVGDNDLEVTVNDAPTIDKLDIDFNRIADQVTVWAKVKDISNAMNYEINLRYPGDPPREIFGTCTKLNVSYFNCSYTFNNIEMVKEEKVSADIVVYEGIDMDATNFRAEDTVPDVIVPNSPPELYSEIGEAVEINTTTYTDMNGEKYRLTCEYEYYDKDGDVEKDVEFRWYIKNEGYGEFLPIIGSESQTLNEPIFDNRDEVKCSVRVKDNDEWSTWVNSTTYTHTINIPPYLYDVIAPTTQATPAQIGDTLTFTASVLDEDSDATDVTKVVFCRDESQLFDINENTDDIVAGLNSSYKESIRNQLWYYVENTNLPLRELKLKISEIYSKESGALTNYSEPIYDIYVYEVDTKGDMPEYETNIDSLLFSDQDNILQGNDVTNRFVFDNIITDKDYYAVLICIDSNNDYTCDIPTNNKNPYFIIKGKEVADDSYKLIINRSIILDEGDVEFSTNSDPSYSTNNNELTKIGSTSQNLISNINHIIKTWNLNERVDYIYDNEKVGMWMYFTQGGLSKIRNINSVQLLIGHNNDNYYYQIFDKTNHLTEGWNWLETDTLENLLTYGTPHNKVNYTRIRIITNNADDTFSEEEIIYDSLIKLNSSFRTPNIATTFGLNPTTGECGDRTLCVAETTDIEHNPTLSCNYVANEYDSNPQAFIAYAVDADGGTSLVRNATYYVNQPPTVDNVEVEKYNGSSWISSEGYALETESLNCTFTNSSDMETYTITWSYKKPGNSEWTTCLNSNFCPTGTNTYLSYTITSPGDKWKCEVTPQDESTSGIPVESEEVTVLVDGDTNNDNVKPVIQSLTDTSNNEDTSLYTGDVFNATIRWKDEDSNTFNIFACEGNISTASNKITTSGCIADEMYRELDYQGNYGTNEKILSISTPSISYDKDDDDIINYTVFVCDETECSTNVKEEAIYIKKLRENIQIEVLNNSNDTIFPEHKAWTTDNLKCNFSYNESGVIYDNDDFSSLQNTLEINWYKNISLNTFEKTVFKNQLQLSNLHTEIGDRWFCQLKFIDSTQSQEINATPILIKNNAQGVNEAPTISEMRVTNEIGVIQDNETGKILENEILTIDISWIDSDSDSAYAFLCDTPNILSTGCVNGTIAYTDTFVPTNIITLTKIFEDFSSDTQKIYAKVCDNEFSCSPVYSMSLNTGRTPYAQNVNIQREEGRTYSCNYTYNSNEDGDDGDDTATQYKWIIIKNGITQIINEGAGDSYKYYEIPDDLKGLLYCEVKVTDTDGLQSEEYERSSNYEVLTDSNYIFDLKEIEEFTNQNKITIIGQVRNKSNIPLANKRLDAYIFNNSLFSGEIYNVSNTSAVANPIIYTTTLANDSYIGNNKIYIPNTATNRIQFNHSYFVGLGETKKKSDFNYYDYSYSAANPEYIILTLTEKLEHNISEGDNLYLYAHEKMTGRFEFTLDLFENTLNYLKITSEDGPEYIHNSSILSDSNGPNVEIVNRREDVYVNRQDPFFTITLDDDNDINLTSMRLKISNGDKYINISYGQTEYTIKDQNDLGVSSFSENIFTENGQETFEITLNKNTLTGGNYTFEVWIEDIAENEQYFNKTFTYSTQTLSPNELIIKDHLTNNDTEIRGDQIYFEWDIADDNELDYATIQLFEEEGLTANVMETITMNSTADRKEIFTIDPREDKCYSVKIQLVTTSGVASPVSKTRCLEYIPTEVTLKNINIKDKITQEEDRLRSNELEISYNVDTYEDILDKIVVDIKTRNPSTNIESLPLDKGSTGTYYELDTLFNNACYYAKITSRTVTGITKSYETDCLTYQNDNSLVLTLISDHLKENELFFKNGTNNINFTIHTNNAFEWEYQIKDMITDAIITQNTKRTSLLYDDEEIILTRNESFPEETYKLEVTATSAFDNPAIEKEYYITFDNEIPQIKDIDYIDYPYNDQEINVTTNVTEKYELKRVVVEKINKSDHATVLRIENYNNNENHRMYAEFNEGNMVFETYGSNKNRYQEIEKADKDTWHHYVIEWNDQNTKSLWIDGILKDSGDKDDISNLELGGNLYLGAFGTSKQSNHFLGEMDELKVFDKLLSEEEIINLSQNKNIDESTLRAAYSFENNIHDQKDNFDGTGYNVAYRNGIQGKSIYFNGEDAYARIPDFNLDSEKGTISFWAKQISREDDYIEMNLTSRNELQQWYEYNKDINEGNLNSNTNIIFRVISEDYAGNKDISDNEDIIIDNRAPQLIKDLPEIYWNKTARYAEMPLAEYFEDKDGDELIYNFEHNENIYLKINNYSGVLFGHFRNDYSLNNITGTLNVSDNKDTQYINDSFIIHLISEDCTDLIAENRIFIGFSNECSSSAPSNSNDENNNNVKRGGGGGGSSSYAYTPKPVIINEGYYKQTIHSTKNGNIVESDLSNASDLSVQEVNFLYDKQISYGTIEVTRLLISPEETDAVKDAYEYFEILLTGFDETQIKDAEIIFKISKYNPQGITPENVKIMRWEKTYWKEYDSSLVYEDEDHHYMKAVVPGFSYWVISKEETTTDYTDIPDYDDDNYQDTYEEPDINTPQKDESQNDEGKESHLNYILYGIIGFVGITGILGGIFVAKKQMLKSVHKEEIEEPVIKVDPLPDYIKKQLDKGIPEEEIKAVLTNVGWKEKDIEEAISKVLIKKEDKKIVDMTLIDQQMQKQIEALKLRNMTDKEIEEELKLRHIPENVIYSNMHYTQALFELERQIKMWVRQGYTLKQIRVHLLELKWPPITIHDVLKKYHTRKR